MAIMSTSILNISVNSKIIGDTAPLHNDDGVPDKSIGPLVWYHEDGLGVW